MANPYVHRYGSEAPLVELQRGLALAVERQVRVDPHILNLKTELSAVSSS